MKVGDPVILVFIFTSAVSPCDSELLMPCDDGRGCILKKFMCDGVVDCVDASDELKCGEC